MSRPLFVAIAIVLFMATSANPAPAAHEPIRVGAYGYGMHGEPGGITIAGSAGRDDARVRSPAPSTLVVSNRSGGAVAEPQCHPGGYLVSPDACGCQSVDTATASCHTPYGIRASAQLLAGDDTIRVFGPVVLSALGGRGADRLTGNRLNDYLRGDQRSDRLSGRGGKDELRADAGRDSAFGGAGNDLLWVQDDDRDRVIDCGSGNDRAYIDRALDPEPVNCEHVHRD